MLTDRECGRVSKDYYDLFAQKALDDYINQNPRLKSCIQYALHWIPSDAERVLDIGCGIGWSTWEIARNRPNATAFGIDLSVKRIEIAKKLFNEPNLTFAINNILMDIATLESPFDAIVMFDVYEHIPKELRNDLHRVFNNILGNEGIVILTTPSIFHQNFLRTHKPEGLQPVDEDVTLEDIHNLAVSINGHVIDYKHVNIWKTNDYIHSLIQRNPKYIQGNQVINNSNIISFETKNERENRVTSRLKIKVTRNGFVIPDRQGPIVCIIHPGTCKSEGYATFIHAHIERLPTKVRVLYGGHFPRYLDDGNPLLPPTNSVFRLLREIWRRVLRLPSNHFEQDALKRFLQTNKVDLVLAEYGPVGVAVMKVCKAARVPLAVYFRGYDVYSHHILENEGQHYPLLFEQATAIFVVSREIEQHLVNLGAPKEKLYYNPSGVDTELFQGADPSSAPLVFVHVGRFTEKKAPHLTLLAFKKVVEIVHEARLIMIGDGPLSGVCKQLSRALGIDSSVEFLGPLDKAKVSATMHRARALVLHSITASNGDSEGTPNVLKEAGASGLPVVATRHGGIPEIVIDGETGFLVEEGDVEGMAKYMIQLANDPVLAAQLGRAARDWVCTEFSMDKSIEKLWRIINAVIQEHGN